MCNELHNIEYIFIFISIFFLKSILRDCLVILLARFAWFVKAWCCFLLFSSECLYFFRHKRDEGHDDDILVTPECANDQESKITRQRLDELHEKVDLLSTKIQDISRNVGNIFVLVKRHNMSPTSTITSSPSTPSPMSSQELVQIPRMSMPLTKVVKPGALSSSFAEASVGCSSDNEVSLDHIHIQYQGQIQTIATVSNATVRFSLIKY